MQVAIRSSTLQRLGIRSCSGTDLAQGNEKSPAFSVAVIFASLAGCCRIILPLRLVRRHAFGTRKEPRFVIIADLNKESWQIELFFRWIKQRWYNPLYPPFLGVPEVQGLCFKTAAPSR